MSLLLSLFALVGAVYAIAKNEAAMQHKIDSLKSWTEYQLAQLDGRLGDRLDGLVHRFELFNQKSESQHEFSRYLINGVREKLDHSIKRLKINLTDIARYLEKQGFVVRPTYTGTDEKDS